MNRLVSEKLSHMVTVVIPVCNEGESLAEIIPEIRLHATEIIIVWDGDYQYAGLEFYHNVNLIQGDGAGLGAAILKGCQAARSMNVIVMDGDGQHPPSAIPGIVAGLQDYEFVGGYRLNRPGMSPGRAILSRLAGFPARLIAPHGDPMTGLFGFKKYLLANGNIKPASWKMGLEIAVKGSPESVANSEYIFRPRIAGESHAGIGPGVEYLGHLVKLYAHVIDLHRMAKFCLVGALGVLINLAVLFFAVEVLGAPYGLAALFGIGFAMISNYSLNKVWTFKNDKRSKRSMESSGTGIRATRH